MPELIMSLNAEGRGVAAWEGFRLPSLLPGTRKHASKTNVQLADVVACYAPLVACNGLDHYLLGV